MTRVRPVICGVDEAGRGPLAGAVFAACVILDPRRPIAGLADSKTLEAPRREQLARSIQKKALAWSVAAASVEEVDRLNILWASMLAMQRAVQMLDVQPTEVLIDGNRCPVLPYPSRAIVAGDATVEPICAASILAKVGRDAYMQQLHERYPQYGFHRHKGYTTDGHIDALQRHGVSPVHRRSFAPVRALIDQGRMMLDAADGVGAALYRAFEQTPGRRS